MWICPTCESSVEDNKKKCPACGRFEDQKDGSQQYCTMCGTKYIINIHERFCINCGHKLEL